MVKVCAIGDCKKRSSYVKSVDLKFFTFPYHSDNQVRAERRKKWINACGRKDPVTGKSWQPRESNNYIYVCSTHFIEGKPSKDPAHPDFVPSLFLPGRSLNDECAQKSLRRFESQNRRTRVRDESSSLLATNIDDVSLSRVSDSDENMDETVFEEPSIPQPMEPNTLCDAQSQTGPASNLFCILDEKEKEILQLKECLKQQQDHNQYLQATVNTARFSSSLIFENDTKSLFYVGLSWGRFLALFTFLTQYLPTPNYSLVKVSKIDQLFYTLVRLRQGDSFEKLGDHAGTSKTTMIEYFWRWINLIFYKCRFFIQWPDRDFIRRVTPPSFRVHFPRMTCIIDCFEIFIESPGNLKTRAKTYSSYKSHTTAKYLIGCNPLGAITFLSRGWGGRASDICIVRESGFINPALHHPGDQILADRGFTFGDELAAVCGAELIIPAFMKGKVQMSAQDVETSRKISSVRIHIERVIGLMKNRFAILQQTIPLRVVQSIKNECNQGEFANLDKLVSCCAILVNLGDGIVKDSGKN